MKATFDNDALGDFATPGEVRLVRLLPGPIERVWEFLIDPKKRARWFCGGVLEQKAGGKVEFAMCHKNLAPGEVPPAKYAEVHDPGVTFEGRVIRCEPPRLLAYTFGSKNSVVTFELMPQGKQVLLVLTHRTRGTERAQLGNYGTGWHLHLAMLVAQMERTPRPRFWALFAKLEAGYKRLSPAAQKS